MHHGEGHLRRSVSANQLFWLWFVVAVGVFLLIFRIGTLQIVESSEYAFISENNTFAKKIVLPVRGDIYGRNGEHIAWNTGEADDQVPTRNYRNGGFSNLLGFVRYPRQDTTGAYYLPQTLGQGGIEELYDRELAGTSGSLVLERNAVGDLVSELYIEKQKDGEDITLSVDAQTQQLLYNTLKEVAEERDFDAGSGVLLDSTTGEIIAIASYPEFNNNTMTNLSGEERELYIQQQDRGAFVHRAISGLYSPGSAIKPFFAIAALEEDIIDPHETIVSKGHISVQSPYDPDIVYTYKDWRVHGALNMYGALAQSSNVYFYYIGGGYGDRIGLGIDRLKTYASIFGFGTPTSLGVFHEPDGLIPSPLWKEQEHGDEWRIGDTYNTVIGQYAFQVTPLQLARATAALANGGYLVEPHFNKGEISQKVKLVISHSTLEVVRDGMRQGVLNGTAKHLKTDAYTIAAKTGTAQVGNRGVINSLVIGFFPYENPKYAFAIVMERGKTGGAVNAARQFFDTLQIHLPEYFRS